MRILNTGLLTLVDVYLPSTCLPSKLDEVRSNEVYLRDYNLIYHNYHQTLPISSYRHLTEEHIAQ